jgi:hypothetical protein
MTKQAINNKDKVTRIQGYIQKFPDWVDNEIYATTKKKHSLRSNTKGYGSKTH